jgi:hypothetical protein
VGQAQQLGLLHRPHLGQLARSCSICALEAELAEVIARRDKLLASALAPSAPDGWRPFLTDVITAAGLLTHGKRDKRLAERIGSFAFDAMRTSAPTPPEVEPALVVEVEPDYWSGGHYYEGSKPHISPLKVWKLPVGTKLYTAPPAPSVPDGWRSAIAKEFPLYDEDGLDEDKHCCEWVMLQERKRLHKILASPTPAEAPADVARDAARLDWLDERNAPHGLGWEIIQMPAGNVHIHTLTGDKAKFESIRDAIDAAIAAEKGGA